MTGEEALALSKKYAQSLALGGATPIPGPPGSNGREVQIQNNGTYIQWRYVGDPSWINIVALSDLKGQDGTDGQNGQDGTNGQDGANGQDGQDGADGQDGQTPQFQMSGNTLQYKFPSQNSWTDLFTFPAGGGGEVDPADLISEDQNNALTLGNDDKLFVPNSAGGYSPPQGGIPREDLSQGVQDSLDKADSALQQGDLPVPADLISSDAGNIIQTGTDGKLFAAADDAINFPVPAYPDAISILSWINVTTEGTVTAPRDGFIHRHSKVEGATYFGARLTINGADPDTYRLNQQSLGAAYAYENTSPLYPVKQGDVITTQVWTDNVGVLKANDILFHEIDYIGQAELPNGGWQRTQLAQDVQDTLNLADDVIPSAASDTNQLIDYQTFANGLNEMQTRQVTPTAAADVPFASLAVLNDDPAPDFYYRGSPTTATINDTASYTSADGTKEGLARYNGETWAHKIWYNSILTPAQEAALNSDITSTLVNKLTNLPNNNQIQQIWTSTAARDFVQGTAPWVGSTQDFLNNYVNNRTHFSSITLRFTQQNGSAGAVNEFHIMNVNFRGTASLYIYGIDRDTPIAYALYLSNVRNFNGNINNVNIANAVQTSSSGLIILNNCYIGSTFRTINTTISVGTGTNGTGTPAAFIDRNSSFVMSPNSTFNFGGAVSFQNGTQVFIDPTATLTYGSLTVDRATIVDGRATNNISTVATAAQGAKADNAQPAIPASTNGYIATHSGTAGTFGTPIDPATLVKKNEVPTSPHLWALNTEVNLGDGSYGRRFAGNITASANSTNTLTLIDDFGYNGWNIVDMGGWVQMSQYYRIPINAQSYQAGNPVLSISATSQVTVDINGDLYFQSWNNEARAMLPYEIWVRYRK